LAQARPQHFPPSGTSPRLPTLLAMARSGAATLLVVCVLAAIGTFAASFVGGAPGFRGGGQRTPTVLRKDLAVHASRKTTELEDAERHHVAILQKRLAEEEEKTAALEERTAALEKEVARLEGRGSSKVVWKFNAADVLAQARARGDKVLSGTSGGMHFTLFPRGATSAAYRSANYRHPVLIYVHGAFEVAGRLSILFAGNKVGGWEWNEPEDISSGRLAQTASLPSVEDFPTYGEVRIVFELTEAVALVTTKSKISR